MPTPTMSPICKATIKPTEEAGDRVVKNHNITETITRPGITSHFGPYLSKKRPMRGERIPFSALPGKSVRPAVNTDSPAPVCRNIGRIIMLDIMINIHDSIRSSPTTYIGYLKTLRFIIGSRMTFCRSMNSTSAMSPTMIEVTTTALLQPSDPSPALLKPKTTPPKPIVDNATDSRSTLGFVTSVTFSKYFSPINNPIIKSGSDNQKI